MSWWCQMRLTKHGRWTSWPISWRMDEASERSMCWMISIEKAWALRWTSHCPPCASCAAWLRSSNGAANPRLFVSITAPKTSLLAATMGRKTWDHDPIYPTRRTTTERLYRALQSHSTPRMAGSKHLWNHRRGPRSGHEMALDLQQRSAQYGHRRHNARNEPENSRVNSTAEPH